MSGVPSTLYDEDEFRAAVHFCWTARDDARSRQRAQGLVNDVGLRSGVTSGRHLDALALLVAKVFLNAGIGRAELHFASRVEVPGYYRAEKKWDLLVVRRAELVAAVEFKSILGSYGNNLNNRSEEAIGNALDVVEGYQEGLLPGNTRPPWLGYVFVLKREERSMRPVRVREPHFLTDPAFAGGSYLKRAELLLHRLIQKRLYAGACLATSDGTGPEAVEEPAVDLTFARFAAGIAGRVAEAMA